MICLNEVANEAAQPWDSRWHRHSASLSLPSLKSNFMLLFLVWGRGKPWLLNLKSKLFMRNFHLGDTMFENVWGRAKTTLFKSVVELSMRNHPPKVWQPKYLFPITIWPCHLVSQDVPDHEKHFYYHTLVSSYLVSVVSGNRYLPKDSKEMCLAVADPRGYSWRPRAKMSLMSRLFQKIW